jgi:hypothetical protein
MIDLKPDINYSKIITLKSLYLIIFILLTTAINIYSFDWYTTYIEMSEEKYGNLILLAIVSKILDIVLTYSLNSTSLYKRLKNV